MSEVTNERALLCELVGEGKTVLDCGCGAGSNARILRDHGCQVIGIEYDPALASQAASVCTEVVSGDLTDPETFARVAAIQPQFDVILCSHVLEHLTDPDSLIKQLKPLCSGAFVIALPNVAHWRVRLQLLRGRWEDTDWGIMDRTHVHFYTLHTARTALERWGLTLEETRFPSLTDRPGALRRLVRGAIRCLGTANLHAGSFLFKCR